jgi:hypothetical protein
MSILSPAAFLRRRRNRDRRPDEADAPADPGGTDAASAPTVDELIDAGRLVDAIEALTETNRSERDPAVDRRILDLRFAAFEQAPRLTEPPPWPDSVPDLFPGELVPEIDRDELTVETLRSGIEHHGSLLVRGLLDDDRSQRLRDGIDRAMAAHDESVDGSVSPELAGWYDPSPECPGVDRGWKAKAGAVLAVDSPPALFDLIEILGETGLTDLARAHFDEPPMLLALKTTLRKVRHDGAFRPGDWHQDGSFMGTGIRSLNIWFALSRCGDVAPGLDIVGRRIDHLAESGTEGALAAWTVGHAVAEREANGTIVRPIFHPGDALVFDHLMLHRTALTPEMDQDRHAVETWLFAPSTYAAMTSTEEQPNPPKDQKPFWL